MAKQTLMPNAESRRRARIAFYLMQHARAMSINERDLARAAGVHPSRLRELHSITPQLGLLHDLGACIEQVARTGKLPQPPTRRRRAPKRSAECVD
jgi:hypothetical protein